jgi:flagellar hook-associated protein 1 FlgK
MFGTFFGLEVATRGLRTQQASVEVTAHNIANANTPGYSRQRADLVTSIPLEVPGLMSANPNQVGTGVQIQQITRLRDAFLDEQYRNQNQFVGEWTVKQNVMEKISAIVNEPSSSGISTALKNFWTAWAKFGSGDTAGAPSAAMELRQSAITLTTTLNEMGTQFAQLQSDLQAQLQATAAQANSYLQQIADLNKAINAVRGAGGTPNDLLDQRDLLIDKLSEMADVTVTETPGSFTLSISGQTVLQDETVTRTIKLPPSGGGTQPANELWTSNITGGQFKGLNDALQTVQQYSSYTDEIARQLATGQVQVRLAGDLKFPSGVSNLQPKDANGNPITGTLGPDGMITVPAGTIVSVNGLNGLLRLGYSQAGANIDPSAIPDFFVSSDPNNPNNITASNISVGVQAEQIAFALRPKTVTDASGNTTYVAIDGDGTLAMTVNSLKTAKFQFPNPMQQGSSSQTTLDDFIQAVVGRMGVEGQQADNEVHNQTALVNQIDTKRQSVSGVSIDEEMANMIKFQQAYGAAARMITTIDQMLNTLINYTGVVGR